MQQECALAGGTNGGERELLLGVGGEIGGNSRKCVVSANGSVLSRVLFNDPLCYQAKDRAARGGALDGRRPPVHCEVVEGFEERGTGWLEGH